MINKLDCELNAAQRYWKNFRRYHQNGMIGDFQRWLKRKEKKNEISQ